jgi:hypothetical protein
VGEGGGEGEGIRIDVDEMGIHMFKRRSNGMGKNRY